MSPDFEKGGGLLPAVIQDSLTGKVLMLGYMNAEALKQTEETGKVTFFSRSKDRLWVKGETSGNFLMVKSIAEDCDKDTILVKAEPQGPTCHTGADTCFDEANSNPITFLNHLRDIIEDRKNNPSDESYTASLFKKGINKVAQKVGEEAVEVVIEAKDDNEDLFLNESADLLYHLMVLLAHKGYSLDDVVKVLEGRHKK
ncbi:bifunctional phosphoribosyl-AMP cyclohydrolase/phosphoribosyl-ATP diphosphatase HisIE [Marinoscillum pacificum]|uniref:bifunctional phosphoribosyl-AMP cyclohydrolase/phosphoribosyl-ATP diphosphatase HisIE n=1 Tax=Marinoscillum pacificum TaxID=392723 RepID=UPI0021577E1D|nr:bifunctional phosphoribosyl-AMP cyclohydrolase/phosphoribosyl-ATP diphosphatase HisIE [Marinoscillum pacificum]